MHRRPEQKPVSRRPVVHPARALPRSQRSRDDRDPVDRPCDVPLVANPAARNGDLDHVTRVAPPPLEIHISIGLVLRLVRAVYAEKYGLHKSESVDQRRRYVEHLHVVRCLKPAITVVDVMFKQSSM